MLGIQHTGVPDLAKEGALIVGVLGLLLTWFNPISIIAHVFLIIGYLAQNHRFYYFYIVLGWISCILLIATGIAMIVLRTKVGSNIFFRLLPLEAKVNGDADAYLAVGIILLVVSLFLQMWFIDIVERAREYLQKKKEHKRTYYGVSASNVFAAPATAGPPYPPSAPAPSPTDNAAPHPEAPQITHGNLYPSVDSAA